MSESRNEERSSMAGMGKWLAVGSELPCAVIIMLYIGQFLGSSWWGPSGAIPGAIMGALVGFVFGVYSVYKTVAYYEHVDTQERTKRTFQPPPEEIYEEFDLPGKSETE